MSKIKTKNKIILSLLILIILIIALLLYFTPKNKVMEEISPPSSSSSSNISRTASFMNLNPIGKASEIKAILEINGKKYTSQIENKISVYDFMDKLRKKNKIDFKEKEYSGMGKFIEEINGIKGNGNNYWMYYINGKKATIGVSNYQINNGDIISWKYENN